ncbi:MAG: hypothetical protein ABIQ91_00315 [Candidatus Paceibacterota bacterium]
METMNDEAKEGYKEFADLSQVLLAGYRSHGNGNNVAMFHLKNGQVVVLFESQKKKTIRGTYDNPKHCYDCRMAIVRHLVM